jgi:hypothetical protein
VCIYSMNMSVIVIHVIPAIQINVLSVSSLPNGMGIWVYVYMGIWVYGYMGIWVYGYMGMGIWVWVYGYGYMGMGIWV